MREPARVILVKEVVSPQSQLRGMRLYLALIVEIRWTRTYSLILWIFLEEFEQI